MIRITSLLLAAALFAGLAHAAETKAPDAPANPAGKAAGKPGSDLHALMKAMGRDFKALNKNLADETQVAANRELVKSLIATTEKCRDLSPPKTDKQPADARPKYLESYKAELEKLVGAFKKIDAALEKKDFAGAKAAADDCKSLTKEGHREFNPKK